MTHKTSLFDRCGCSDCEKRREELDIPSIYDGQKGSWFKEEKK